MFRTTATVTQLAAILVPEPVDPFDPSRTSSLTQPQALRSPIPSPLSVKVFSIKTAFGPYSDAKFKRLNLNMEAEKSLRSSIWVY